MVGITVGYEASVERSATITVPYRCKACGFTDTALVTGMGSGSGGGRGYGKDDASGLANVAASEEIEADAKSIARAIRCPKCGFGGIGPETLQHGSVAVAYRQARWVTVALVFFLFPLVFTGWIGLLIAVGAVAGGVMWGRKRKARAIEDRLAHVEWAVAEAALWSVNPERFPQQQR